MKLAKRLQEVAEASPLPEGREWLVVVMHGWARGPSLGKAATRACRLGTGATPARGPMMVAHVEPGARVDGLGRFHGDVVADWTRS